MYKFVGALFLFLWTVAVFAQDSYIPSFSTSKPAPRVSNISANSSKVLPASTGPTLSPKDFRGAVNSTYQQNQNQLNQQIQENLTKNLPVAKPNMNALSQMPSGNQSAPQPQQQYTTPVPPPAEGTPADVPVEQSQTMQQQTLPPPTQYQQPAPVAAPAAPSQNKPYTGFGAGNNNASGKSTTTPQKSGGWNIQY